MRHPVYLLILFILTCAENQQACNPLSFSTYPYVVIQQLQTSTYTFKSVCTNNFRYSPICANCCATAPTNPYTIKLFDRGAYKIPSIRTFFIRPVFFAVLHYITGLFSNNQAVSYIFIFIMQ